jgi:hypothetical protein
MGLWGFYGVLKPRYDFILETPVEGLRIAHNSTQEKQEEKKENLPIRKGRVRHGSEGMQPNAWPG